MKFGKLNLLVALVCFSAYPADQVTSRVEETMLPVLTFEHIEESSTWRANAWGGGSSSCSIEKSDRFAKTLKLMWDKSATFSSPDSFKTLSTKLKEIPATGIYLWCRGDTSKGSFVVSMINSHEGVKYKYDAKVLPWILGKGNDWQLIRVVFSATEKNHARPFSPVEFEQIQILGFGTGIIEIGEIGLLTTSTDLTLKLTNPNRALLTVQPVHDAGITIDGAIDKTEWEGATVFRLESIKPSGEKSQPAEPTEIFLLRSAEGLYCAARCSKSDMTQIKADYTEDHIKVYEDECVELYFTPALSHDPAELRKFAINANGKVGTLLFNQHRDNSASWKVAANRTTSSWDVEFYVPWIALGIEGNTADMLGFNVTRQTWGERPERSGWTTMNWQALDQFGRLVLGAGSVGQPLATEKLGLANAGPGSYLFSASSNTNNSIAYSINLLKENRVVKSITGRLSGDQRVIPFSIANASAGNYRINGALVDSKENRVLCFESTFVDHGTQNIAVRQISDISLFPEPKVFRLDPACRSLGQRLKYFIPQNTDFVSGEEYLASELAAYYGLKIERHNDIAHADIIIGIGDIPEIAGAIKDCDMTLEYAKVKHDGFLLLATDKKVLITAKEKRGLLYGVNSFLDLVKMSSGEAGDPRICNVLVVDWPHCAIRPWIHLIDSFYPKTRYSPEMYLEMLNTIPLRFRYNQISIELGKLYLWPSVSNYKNSLAWTTDDMKKVVAGVNRRYCTMMPTVQSLGHMSWFFANIPPLRKFVDNLGTEHALLNTEDPDAYAALFAIFTDMLTACSATNDPYLRPEYFHIGMDEVWFDSHKKPQKSASTDGQRYLSHLQKCNDFLKRKGIRPVIWADMLSDTHNGLNESKIGQIRKMIPREAIVAAWSASRDDPALPELHAQGNSVWKVNTGYNVSRQSEDIIEARGIYVCAYHWWLSFNRQLYSVSLYGPIAQALMANAAWNNFPDFDNSTWSTYINSYGKWLMHNWSRKPMPDAASTFFTVDLSAVVNETVIDSVADDGNGWFDLGAEFDLSRMDFTLNEIEGIPTGFNRSNGTVKCVLLRPNSKQSKVIDINRNAASLVLLHTSYLPPEQCQTLSNSKIYTDNPQGLPIAQYRVTYEDGNQELFTVNFGFNVGNWLYTVEKFGRKTSADLWNDQPGVFNKFLIDSRSFWEGTTKAAYDAKYNGDIAIHQYEWVNPHPRTMIKQVEISYPGDNPVSYALLALSGRNTKN